MLIHESAARILTCGRILRFDLTEKLVPDSFGEADRDGAGGRQPGHDHDSYHKVDIILIT